MSTSFSRRDFLRAAGAISAMPLISYADTFKRLQGPQADDTTVTLLFTNDQHARVEPQTMRQNQYGGYARQASLIQKRMSEDKNPVLLSAGDVFQGTLYFNVYEGLADVALMNPIGYQAMTLGNHEFDKGPGAIAEFAKRADFPMLAANLDCTREPLLADLVKPSTVLEVADTRLGIVGAIVPSLFELASPGPNIQMKPLVPSVQAEVDALRAQGIDKVILLTHLGYREDLDLIREIRGAQLVIGGHSHTLLGQYDNSDFPGSMGPYPTQTRNAEGKPAVVLQAWCWGLLLGRCQVTFDGHGDLKSWSNELPFVVDSALPEEPAIANFVAAFRRPIVAVANAPVAEAPNGIPTGNTRRGESLMANVIADAQLEATKQSGSVAALMNAGGVRGSCEPGTITYGSAITVQPFNNTLVVLELKGSELRAALEHGLSRLPNAGGLLHVSKGFKYVGDITRPEGSRLVEAKLHGEEIDPNATYTVTINSFIANGGDGHETLKNAPGKRVDTGLLDIDALVDYLKAHSPIDPKPEDRLRIIGAEAVDVYSSLYW